MGHLLTYPSTSTTHSLAWFFAHLIFPVSRSVRYSSLTHPQSFNHSLTHSSILTSLFYSEFLFFILSHTVLSSLNQFFTTYAQQFTILLLNLLHIHSMHLFLSFFQALRNISVTHSLSYSLCHPFIIHPPFLLSCISFSSPPFLYLTVYQVQYMVT